MAEGHPSTSAGGRACSPGPATEGSDTLGNATSPSRAVSAKALKGGSAPGGRWFKRRTFASRGRCPLIVLLPFQGVDCSCGLPGVALPSVADPGLQANPPSSGLGWPSALLCATGGAGWLKAIPRPPQEGEPVARGRANEVSDTPGDAASPPRAVSAKALKGGSAPGGRGLKRYISA